MRSAFCDAMAKLFHEKPFVFLTGDLGFSALEPLQKTMAERFINAGVAEQNMVSVAAGIAAQGHQAWAYSIAPFIYARPFEQIRNDICTHDLDVKLVGNGGGYGYGSMGSTHHALEDYGVLLTLRHLKAYVPTFAGDVAPMVAAMARDPHPAYLRLGRDELPKGLEVPAYAPWRRLLAGKGPVIIAIGPLAGPIAAALLAMPVESRPELWVLSELPLASAPIPPLLLEKIQACRHLCVVEEHVAQGGAGAAIASDLMKRGLGGLRFDHCHAKGYPSGTYGSQAFHRQESGLDPASVLAVLSKSAAA